MGDETNRESEISKQKTTTNVVLNNGIPQDELDLQTLLRYWESSKVLQKGKEDLFSSFETNENLSTIKFTVIPECPSELLPIDPRSQTPETW